MSKRRRASLKSETAQEKLYEGWKLSGKNAAAYSREHGVSYWTLRTAIKKSQGSSEKHRRRTAPEQFKEIALPVVAGGGGYNVTLRNGRELNIPEHFHESQVRILLEILESC